MSQQEKSDLEVVASGQIMPMSAQGMDAEEKNSEGTEQGSVGLAKIIES